MLPLLRDDRKTQERIREHDMGIRLADARTSAVSEHAYNIEHRLL